MSSFTLAVALLIVPVAVLATAPMSPCADNNDLCTFWSTLGECETNPDYMLKQCAMACGSCQGKGYGKGKGKGHHSKGKGRGHNGHHNGDMFELTPPKNSSEAGPLSRQVTPTADGCFKQITDADWQCVQPITTLPADSESDCLSACLSTARCRSAVFGAGECKLFGIGGIQLKEHKRGKRQIGAPTIGRYHGQICKASVTSSTGYTYSESTGVCTEVATTQAPETTTEEVETTTEAETGCQNYYIVPEQVLFGFANDVQSAVSLEECLTMCIAMEDDCVSGMFVRTEDVDNCILNYESEETVPDQIEFDEEFDYFEPRCID